MPADNLSTVYIYDSKEVNKEGAETDIGKIPTPCFIGFFRFHLRLLLDMRVTLLTGFYSHLFHLPVERRGACNNRKLPVGEIGMLLVSKQFPHFCSLIVK